MDGWWKTPESAPSLVEDTLQIWRIDLDDTPEKSGGRKVLLEQATSVLTTDERERAARMRVGGPQEEFMVGRGCLRHLLGAALRCAPAAVALEKAEHGKPFVRTSPGFFGPSFNVAHSHGIILIGLSMVGEIGVDVEIIDSTIDLEGVARTAFHVEEVARVHRASTLEERVDVFYRCWTRKEALAKADGRGLTLEPTTYAAGLDAVGEQGVTLPGIMACDKLFVREIEVGSSHRAAFAVRVPDVSVCTYQFPIPFGKAFPE